MRISLTRTIGFRATHRLYNPAWSPEENRTRFGWTADEPGHPHDYSCAVTVTGPLEDDRIVDLPVLDGILATEITQRLDGKHLNLDLPEFAYGRALATCEAIARDIFQRIAARLPAGIILERVRVAEDATLHADCSDDGVSGEGRGERGER
jgi:6-pyruvoyltetrahydropterin/6-carboxytetrahydropterin synthase